MAVDGRGAVGAAGGREAGLSAATGAIFGVARVSGDGFSGCEVAIAAGAGSTCGVAIAAVSGGGWIAA